MCDILSLFHNNTQLQTRYPQMMRLFGEIGQPVLNFLQENNIVRGYIIEGSFNHGDGSQNVSNAWSNFTTTLNEFIAQKLKTIDP